MNISLYSKVFKDSISILVNACLLPGFSTVIYQFAVSGIEIKSKLQINQKNMCGIWALITKAKFNSHHLEAYQTVKPRGPDHSTLHFGKSSIIGFHRLAINDVHCVKAEQPFCRVEGDFKYTAICNGEIYNHQELREKYDLKIETSNDCSIVLPLFQALGDDFELLNQELHGQYALFIVRESIKTGIIHYWLSTDPLSVRPAFYFSSETEFGASSLLSGLSKFRSDVVRMDQGSMLGGRFDPVSNQNILLYVKKYTQPQTVIYHEQSMELYQKIVDTVIQSIERRLMSDRPLGCLLSGGLDSSLVASIAASLLKERGQKLRTFSIGMQQGTDIFYARQVAAHIGSDHTQFIYEPHEGLEAIKDVINVTETFDITTIRASVGQYLLAKKISEFTDITVVLNGDGADECQMGYLYFYLAPTSEEAVTDRDRIVQEIHLYDGLRVDRNISHFGLESRVPFLDENFVNLFYQISPNLLTPRKDRMEKNLLRRAFEVIRPDVLPKAVLWRKKEAFSDGVSSKQKSWYQMVKEHVNETLLPELMKDVIPAQAADADLSPEEAIKRMRFDGLQPVCEQSKYYRLLHSRLFNNNHEMFKHYWLPSWANTSEPSARTLGVYEHNSDEEEKVSNSSN